MTTYKEAQEAIAISYLDEVLNEIVALKKRRQYFRDRIRDINGLAQRPSGKDSILSYLLCFIGEPVHTDELLIVSGIADYARRIRELRVEHGFEIISGSPESGVPNNHYLLASAEANAESAAAWRQAYEVRKIKRSGKDRILELFQRSIDVKLSIDQLAYVSGMRDTAQQIRELRSHDGWRIFCRLTGGKDLRPDQYVMASTEPLPSHDREIPNDIYEAVMERDRCRCRKCGWSPEAAKPGSRRQFLELHRRFYDIKGGANDESNLFALCNMHHDEVHDSELDEKTFDSWLNDGNLTIQET
jgi:hypothetical protein